MADLARRLAVHTDSPRTRHSYYRDIRLLHQHFGCDPAGLAEEQVFDYILHVKTVKGWRPKTIRQTVIDRGLIGDKLSTEELDRRLDVLAMAKVADKADK